MREEHKMPQVRTRRIGLLAVAVVLISLRLAHAMGAGIQDAAGFFSKDAIATAEQQITAIHQKFGKDLRVETYAHIPTDRADQYVPEKRHEFFATWAYQRAKALGLDGVIVLICKDPAFLQVEVGERTKQRAFTLANRDHLRELLVTAFRQRQSDDGLRQVVAYYGQTLHANLGAASTGARPSLPAPQEFLPRVPQGNRNLFWLIGILVAVGLCLGWVLRRRSGPGEERSFPPSSGYAPSEYRSAPPGVGYPPPDARYGSGGGGGFGRGFGAGILGGLLGGWLGNRLSHRDASASSDAFAPPDDPSPSTPGGGDNTSPGPDFSGEVPSDFGGGGDFGAEQEGNDDSTDDDGGGDCF
jgi:uncharacterized membrane protein YgcG